MNGLKLNTMLKYYSRQECLVKKVKIRNRNMKSQFRFRKIQVVLKACIEYANLPGQQYSKLFTIYKN